MKKLNITLIAFFLSMPMLIAKAGNLHVTIQNRSNNTCYPVSTTTLYSDVVVNFPSRIGSNETISTTIESPFSDSSFHLKIIFRCGEMPNEKYIGLFIRQQEPNSIGLIVLAGMLGGDLPYYGGVEGRVLKEYTDQGISASFTGSPTKTRIKNQDGYAQWVIQ